MAEDTEMNYFAKFSLDNSNFMSGMTGMAISFDAVVMAAQTSFAAIQQGYEQTVGFAIKYMDALDSVSDATGISIENAQRLRAAAVGVGTDFDDASTALRMFTQRVGDTGAAGESLRSQLAGIGVQVKDVNGNYKDMYTLMMETNTALKNMPESTQRAALAADIYGRSWYNIVDMIEKADVAIEKSKIKDLFTEEDNERAKKFQVHLDEIGAGVEKIKVKIGLNILDAIGQNAFISGDWANTAIGKALGWKDTAAKDEAVAPIEAVDKATVTLYDKYSGYRSDELDLALAKEEVAKAQEAVTGAKTQAEMDKYSAKLQQAKNHVDDLREAMAKAAQGTTTMGKAMTTSWSGTSVVGEAGSEMQLFMQKEMDAGVDYQTAMQNWMNASPTAGPGKNTVAGQSMSPAKKESEAVLKAARETTDGMLVEYIKQEEHTKVHWTAITEMMRLSVTDMATNWRKYVDFAAGYPTIHNIGIVVWNKGVPDWTPESNVVFMQAARRAQLASQDLSFKATDLSQVETNASKQQNSVNLTIINEKNVSSKVIQENSQATAANLSVNGAS